MSCFAPSGYTVSKKRLDPITRIILIAVYDDKNIWSKLGGMRYIVKEILDLTKQFNKHYWPKYIESYELCLSQRGGGYDFSWTDIKFPKPTGININMMPFIMSYRFEFSHLPNYLETYFNQLIKPCIECDFSQKNRICFLTIQESVVEKGKTQRRPGLHIENSGKIQLNEIDLNEDEKLQQVNYNKGGGENYKTTTNIYVSGRFGGGYRHSMYSRTDTLQRDGVYIASTVDATCQAWNCKIVSKDEKEVIGHLGDIEHLRDSLNTLYDDKKQILKSNWLYWLTDRTPHEVLPMKQSGYRQFFRLVTHDVSIWHQQHSTANPNGIVPDPKITRIIKTNKFDTC